MQGIVYLTANFNIKIDFLLLLFMLALLLLSIAPFDQAVENFLYNNYTQFFINAILKNEASVALNPFVSLIGRLVALRQTE